MVLKFKILDESCPIFEIWTDFTTSSKMSSVCVFFQTIKSATFSGNVWTSSVAPRRSWRARRSCFSPGRVILTKVRRFSLTFKFSDLSKLSQKSPRCRRFISFSVFVAISINSMSCLFVYCPVFGFCVRACLPAFYARQSDARTPGCAVSSSSSSSSSSSIN